MRERTFPLVAARYPTPTMSSSRVNPWETPVTMLYTWVRTTPCRAPEPSSFSSRTTFTSCPSTESFTPFGSLKFNFPFGPSTRTVSSLMLTFTPCANFTGALPTRDINHQTSQRISPPTLCWAAFWVAKTPFEVERMEVPTPPRTFGIAPTPAYLRTPGLLTRRIPRITLSP